jgi:putative ABC transport system permease protein
MLKLAFKNLIVLKTRYLLAGIIIAIGVAFVCSNLIISGGLRSTLESSLAGQDKKADVFIQTDHLRLGQGDFSFSSFIPFSLLHLISELPGVRYSSGEVITPVAVLDKSGHAIGAFGSSIGIGLSGYTPNPWVSLKKGAYPVLPNEVAIDQSTYNAAGIALGNTIKVALSNGSIRAFKLVGIIEVPPNSLSFFGASVLFNFKQAIQSFSEKGFDEIAVLDKRGYSESEVSKEITNLINTEGLANQVNVETSQAKLRQDEAAIVAASAALGGALNSFALIALIVAGVVIANSFRISAFQREKQLALLRLIGATKSQVFKLVFLEALLVGGVFSIIGIPLGILLALIGAKVITHFSATFSVNPFSEGPTIFILPLIVGLITSAVGVLAPARFASKVSPVRALSQAEEIRVQGAISRVRIFTGLIGILLGGLVIFLSISHHLNIVLVASGGAIIFVSLLILQPLVVPLYGRLSSLVTTLIVGFPGKLASKSFEKNPTRTSATAVSVTIGLTLVVLFGTVFSSISASVQADLFNKAPFDYVIISTFRGIQIPESLVNALSKDSRYFVTNPVYDSVVYINTTGTSFNAPGRVGVVDPSFFKFLKIKSLEGSLGYLNPNDVVVSQSIATNWSLHVGSTFWMFPTRNSTTGATQKTVVAVIPSTDFLHGIIIPITGCFSLCGNKFLGQVFINSRNSLPNNKLQRLLQIKVDPYPFVAVESIQSLKALISSAVTTLVVVFDALLSIALLIAFFGITNTLTLSLIERRRELAVLTAMGMSRLQLYLSIVVEGLLVGLFGALSGVVIGIAGGFGIIQALHSQGINVFSIPVAQIVLYIVIALIVSWLASFLPAYRASKIPVIEAMNYI